MKQWELSMTSNVELKLVGAVMFLIGVNVIIGWGG